MMKGIAAKTVTHERASSKKAKQNHSIELGADNSKHESARNIQEEYAFRVLL